MFAPSQYEMVDFGAGRKLERIGGELLDRPSPAAEGVEPANPDAWASASAHFDPGRRGSGRWSGRLADRTTPRGDGIDDVDEVDEVDGAPWSVTHGRSRLLMQLGPSGNVGLFPEQADNWAWIADQVRSCRRHRPANRPRVLNLFAYTGGASLAAAIAGAEVTHIDSSGPSVAWAKRNAAASGVADLPVRWLVEDAMTFVARERRRGNRYDGIVADPPTYGHGPKGRPFKFKQHLDALVEACGELLGPSDASDSSGDSSGDPSGDSSGPGFFLFSCHAPGFGPADAVETVSNVLPAPEAARVSGRRLVLESADGRALDAGVAARWSAFA